MLLEVKQHHGRGSREFGVTCFSIRVSCDCEGKIFKLLSYEINI